MDLTRFADDVGPSEPVTITGRGSRGGPVPGVRKVSAPDGIVELLPAEMTVRCGAGTPIADLSEALGEHGQYVALPAGGTVGGALASGRSDVYRLGRGPVRDTLLQVRYVSAEGRVIKAGGATVKNVTGFDLCRLLVGSHGTLGFLGELILRTKPRPDVSRWFQTEQADPDDLLRRLYRPSSILWDGRNTWVCLEGHADDVKNQAQSIAGASEVSGPPPLPATHRFSMPASQLRSLTGSFVAEIGVGIVHLSTGTDMPSLPTPSPGVVMLNRRIKELFDPTGRLNPGVDVLAGVGRAA